MSWWESFFDESYLALWGPTYVESRTQRELDELVATLSLLPGASILDAPCGYGRTSRPLAERGFRVTGVDQSTALLAEAERRRGNLPPDELRYVHHDLRAPLAAGDFDLALNLYSSLGYGTEADDAATLANLRGALRVGGRLFLETIHRDLLVIGHSKTARPSYRLPDGTLVIEEPRFDPVRGRVTTTWFWSGPNGEGEKRAELRVYTITELVALAEGVGLRFVSSHRAYSSEPFVFAPDGGGRVGLLFERG